jgi:hypothetical protein
VVFDPTAGPWYTLTGQLDHPAAATCASTVPIDAAGAAAIVAACRATFVVTAIEGTATP